MNIPFTKMHGLGNDFILIEEDQLASDIDLSDLSRHICDRHFGIGADGLIIIAPPEDPNCDIQFKFYNSDGSRSEMCGNGIRCFARYVVDQGLIKRHEFKIETLAGIIIPNMNKDGTVTVNMGRPVLNPEKIPFKGTTEWPVLSFNLKINENLTLPIAVVSMGNPHAIIFKNETKQAIDFNVVGPVVEKHTLFPAKTNVHFVDILNKRMLKVISWERGAGSTLACGSGACAVVVAAVLKELVEHEITVQLPGGDLKIEWNGKDSVFMTGPVNYIFAGIFPFIDQNVAAR